LDKSILCDLPDYEDRLSILQVVSQTMETSEISFEKIASETEGFTGADLQGLLYSAQLQAINERMEYTTVSDTVIKNQIHPTIIQGDANPMQIQEELDVLVETKTIERKQDPIVVRMNHVKKALKETKPSLRKEEYVKFKHKYQQFLGEESVPVGIKASFQ
jgi:peroxin-1